MTARRALVAAILAFVMAVNAAAQRACERVTIEGEVEHGQQFKAQVTPGVAFLLAPVTAGWRIKIQPRGESPAHDAAEVATPPYQSLSPLLISTDYGLRAQDAVAWNPREFAFTLDTSRAGAASQQEDLLLSKTAGEGEKKAAERALMELVGHAAHGVLQITDAGLVPGTADQSAVAASVATHWRTTHHELLQPERAARATPLGSLQRLHFKATLSLPRGTPVVKGLVAIPAACIQ